MKKLPIGISTFSEIINENYLYVDKTQDIYKLINFHKFLFLSRPRRFGKSLLVSTLEQVFLGNKELFKGLDIYNSDYDWKKYPIIKIDFSAIGSKTSTELERDLIYKLNDIAALYDISLIKEGVTNKLSELIQKLSATSKVVILIDEYDSPITSNIENLEVTKANQRFLFDFYKTLKSYDGLLHKVFITGVTKVAKTSVFSGFNNVLDISLDPKFQTIVGYTQKELENNFKEYIDYISAKSTISINNLLEQIKYWYNGYNFAESIRTVYNPFSIALFFNSAITKVDNNLAVSFDSHWIETGTSRYLIYIAKTNTLDLIKLIEQLNINKSVEMPFSALSSFEPEAIPLNTLLLQTGYLTITKYDNDAKKYYVYYPNNEVKIALETYLLAALFNTTVSDIDSKRNSFRDDLEKNNLERFFIDFQALIASFPNMLLREDYGFHNRESFYHIIMQAVMHSIGLQYRSEESTNIGRIDLAVESKNFIYIFEMKINNEVDKTDAALSKANEALEQIESKKYYQKYLSSNKIIILVGVSFNSQTKDLTWISKKLV